jgi:predicted NAD/FAD-dependent oxidoreductase
MATRREENAAWDHGAQYFTVREPAFAALVARASPAGEVARWVPRWPGGEQESRELWVGTPGISALPRFLAQGLDVTQGTRIVSLARGGAGWILRDDRGADHPGFDFVVLAVPAPQAAALAAGHSGLAARAGTVGMAPCWAVMVAFERPLEAPVDAGWEDEPVLPWFARNSSKPRRSGLDAWVLHAGAEWSRERIETPATVVQASLLERLAVKLGTALPPAASVAAHRWRHARVEAPVGEAFLLDRAAGLACCGDWCLDARVEAAFMSGDALGGELAGGPGRL